MSRRRKPGPGRARHPRPAPDPFGLRPPVYVERLVLEDGHDCPFCSAAGIRVEADGSITQLQG